jgi:hypothetical protein
MASFSLPEAVLTGEKNKLICDAVDNKWSKFGYYAVMQHDFNLTSDEWLVIWIRYPGPIRRNIFYTKDPFFKSATTKQLREIVKVHKVEEKLDDR